MSVATASQTIGPYWHLVEDRTWADLTRFGAQGEKIVLTGRVLDGDGNPCSDACIEIWQTDPPTSDTFPGFGRRESRHWWCFAGRPAGEAGKCGTPRNRLVV